MSAITSVYSVIPQLSNRELITSIVVWYQDFFSSVWNLSAVTEKPQLNVRYNFLLKYHNPTVQKEQIC